MNNSMEFNFERNRYFTGKLLTAQDFKIEQQYHISKRQLINKLALGSGIVCGLQVIPVTDKMVSLESGIAIDQFGREIVVSSTVTQNLSKISGFPVGEFAGSLFLCLVYEENDKDPAYTVENAAKDGVYNRVKESFSLVLKKEPPVISGSQLDCLVKDSRIIYSDDKLQIWQEMPKYVSPNEVFEVTVKVEKLAVMPKLEISFDVSTESIGLPEGETNRIVIKEPDRLPKTVFEHKYFLKACEEAESIGKISINGKVHIKAGDKVIEVESSYASKPRITEKAIEESVIKNYFDMAVENCLELNCEQYIYLAKISMVQVVTNLGSTYSIEKVEKVENAGYVLNPILLYNLISSLNKKRPSAEALYDIQRSSVEEAAAAFEDKPETTDTSVYIQDEQKVLKQPNENMTCGKVDINIASGVKAAKKYFSDEIEHGLGAGNVLINVGLEDAESNILEEVMQNGERVYYGDSSVFEDSAFSTSMPAYSIGTVVYPKKGTFRIGINFENAVKYGSIRVKWWAFRNIEPEKEKIEVTLAPEFIDIKVGGTYQFVPSVNGTKNKAVWWKVNEPNGGRIDDDGFYISPESKGVYSVTASSKEDSSRNATVYIVVKE